MFGTMLRANTAHKRGIKLPSITLIASFDGPGSCFGPGGGFGGPDGGFGGTSTPGSEKVDSVEVGLGKSRFGFLKVY